MSWYEYSDMFEKAQERGQFKCFIFDIKDSKKGYDNNKLLTLLSTFKSSLKKDIIHTNTMYQDVPCVVSGDIIMLLIKRGSISDEEVYNYFKEAKDKSEINKDFHYLSGYYETDDWVNGNTEYYLGYCIQELEYRSKEKGLLI